MQRRHQAQEPKGGGQWISGDPLAYANWAAGKPNNLEQIEDDGHLFRVAGSKDPATWNDFANDPTQLSVVRAKRPVAYIVEFDRQRLKRP